MNGLRGVAIASVVWHHTSDVLIPLPPSERVRALTFGGEAGWFVLAPLAVGWFGVRLFFVLSGFVLMLPYARGLRTFDDWTATRAFYAHRARRLLPLFALSVLVCSALVFPADSWRTLAELGMTLSGLFTFSKAYLHPRLNPLLWSLGVEIWLTVIFPLLARAILRIGVPVCIAVATFVALASALVERSRVLGGFSLVLFASVDAFVAGMCVAAVLVARQGTMPRAGALTFAGVLGVYGASVLAVAGETALVPAWAIDLATSLATLGFAAILAGLSFSGRGLMGRLIANPLIQVAGMMCYSIYVWHYVLLLRFVSRFHEDVLRYPLFLVILLALSALTYRYVEFGQERDGARLFRAIR